MMDEIVREWDLDLCRRWTFVGPVVCGDLGASQKKNEKNSTLIR